MTQLQTELGMVRVPAGTWAVDPSHSSVAFEIKHMMISTVRGMFGDYEGVIEAAEDSPANSRAWGVVRVASIDTANADRDAHLRSAEFFDVETHPDASFESTAVEHQEGGHYRLRGDLTIKGQKREIDLDACVDGAATDPWGNDRVGITIRGSIDRTDFGLTWQQALASGGLLVGEEVKILIDISAIRQGGDGDGAA